MTGIRLFYVIVHKSKNKQHYSQINELYKKKVTYLKNKLMF